MTTPRSAAVWLAGRLELGRAADASNLRPMEGLRGFAVMLVFMVHYATLIDPWTAGGPWAAVWLGAAHDIGNAGVDLFFVLSGYLIYATLVESRRPFARYMARRLQRIYPAFLVVFAVYVALNVARDTGRIPADPVQGAIYLLQNLLLLPGLFPIDPLISVAWSLSYEIFYYLAMPLLVGLFRLRGRARPWRLGFLGVLSFAALAGFAVGGGPVRLVLFLAGAMLHEVQRIGRWPAPNAAVGLVAGLTALAVMLPPMPGAAAQALRTAVMCVGFGLLCHAGFGRPDQALGAALSWTPLRWLGNMSYSYYLIHGLALHAFLAALSTVLPPVAGHDLSLWLLLPSFAATLIPALALFLAVERPLSLSGAGAIAGGKSVAAA